MKEHKTVTMSVNTIQPKQPAGWCFTAMNANKLRLTTQHNTAFLRNTTGLLGFLNVKAACVQQLWDGVATVDWHKCSPSGIFCLRMQTEAEGHGRGHGHGQVF